MAPGYSPPLSLNALSRISNAARRYLTQHLYINRLLRVLIIEACAGRPARPTTSQTVQRQGVYRLVRAPDNISRRCVRESSTSERMSIKRPSDERYSERLSARLPLKRRRPQKCSSMRRPAIYEQAVQCHRPMVQCACPGGTAVHHRILRVALLPMKGRYGTFVPTNLSTYRPAYVSSADRSIAPLPAIAGTHGTRRPKQCVPPICMPNLVCMRVCARAPRLQCPDDAPAVHPKSRAAEGAWRIIAAMPLRVCSINMRKRRARTHARTHACTHARTHAPSPLEEAIRIGIAAAAGQHRSKRRCC